ncbi:hypothetical protein DFH09DRAFT_1380191, partial [Mycena vulgaris]
MFLFPFFIAVCFGDLALGIFGKIGIPVNETVPATDIGIDSLLIRTVTIEGTWTGTVPTTSTVQVGFCGDFFGCTETVIEFKPSTTISQSASQLSSSSAALSVSSAIPASRTSS